MKVEVQSPYNRICISHNREGHRAFAVFLLSFFVGKCRRAVSGVRCRSPPLHLDFYIGLCGITGVTSRYVVSLAGVVIAICSICPKLCAIFSVIPYPILGGVALTAFGTILVSGMNVIRNSELTSRETTIVGVSLAVGIGFSMVPDSLAAFPFWASSLLSGVPGTALTAIVLSLLLKENKTDDTRKGDEK